MKALQKTTPAFGGWVILDAGVGWMAASARLEALRSTIATLRLAGAA